MTMIYARFDRKMNVMSAFGRQIGVVMEEEEDKEEGG
jgi:hypothetical protein